MRAIIAVVAIVVAGCPVNELRDGIGATCSVDGPPCARDHVCLADDGVADGLCAPIFDYGACTPPSYPQVLPQTFVPDDAVHDVDEADDLRKVDDIARVEGSLFVDARAGNTLLVGDLCRLRGLQQVTGSLLIAQTDIESLDGLQGLASVGAGLGIAANRNLTDLKALENLVRVGFAPDRTFSIVIADNVNLPEDAVASLRTALAARPSIVLHVCGNSRANTQNDETTCGAGVNALLRRE